MYLPQHHAENDVRVLHELIRRHPLGLWVTHGDGELLANHIPFLLDSSRGELGTLCGHVARANPVWKAFSTTVESIVAFQGPDAYITPSWYPSKEAHGKAVPTWNYAVVHAHGTPQIIEDADAVFAHIEQLTETHEAGRAPAWKVADAPADYTARLVQAIVAIEIPIARLIGKWKVSQNRPEQDKVGVIAGLRAEGTAQADAMAALVQQHSAHDGA